MRPKKKKPKLREMRFDRLVKKVTRLNRRMRQDYK